MTTTIYILRLEGGRFYVGKAQNPTARFAAHRSGQGSAWTRKWKPIAIDRVIPGLGPFDEDRITKELMFAHGIDAVRGGAYSQIDLDDAQLATLKTEIWGAMDRCIQCGRADHFASNCRYRTDIGGRPIGPRPTITVAQISCARCGQIFTSQFDRSYHERTCEDQLAEIVIDESANDTDELRPDTCGRCGRTSHAADKCHAASDIMGRRLPATGRRWKSANKN